MALKAHVEPQAYRTNKSRAATSMLRPAFLESPSVLTVIPETSSWSLFTNNLKTTGLAKQTPGLLNEKTLS